jgi:hypothetical protein
VAKPGVAPKILPHKHCSLTRVTSRSTGDRDVAEPGIVTKILTVSKYCSPTQVRYCVVAGHGMAPKYYVECCSLTRAECLEPAGTRDMEQ